MKVILEIQVPDELAKVAAFKSEQFQRLIEKAYTNKLESVEERAIAFVKGCDARWLTPGYVSDSDEDEKWRAGREREYMEALETLKQVVSAYKAEANLEVKVSISE